MDELLQWSEKYSVNCPEIDEQHKGLFDTINKLYRIFNEASKEDIMEVLNTLYNYTEEHFNTEEALFEIYDYPGKKQHKQEHKDFVNKVLEFTRKFDEGDEMLGFEIMFFLKDWIIEHIMYSDRKYIDYICK